MISGTSRHIIQATLSRINTIKRNGPIAMSFISNVHRENAVKEHVGFVVLRAQLAARNSTQTQQRADNGPRDTITQRGRD